MLSYTKFQISETFFTQMFFSVSNQISLVLVKHTLHINLRNMCEKLFTVRLKTLTGKKQNAKSSRQITSL